MRRLTLAMLLWGILVATAEAQPAAEATREPESQANGIFRVTADPKSGLANEDLLWRMINNSPPIAQRALLIVSNELKLSPAPEAKAIHIEAINWNEYNHGGQRVDAHRNQAAGVGMVYVSVKSFDERIDAKKLLAAVRAALANQLRELDPGRSQEESVKRELERVGKLGEKLQKSREELMALASIHKVEIDPALQAQKRLRLETELQGLKVQLNGLEARQKIIEHQIGKIGGKVDPSPARAAAQKALEARLVAQQAFYQRMMASNNVQAGSVTVSEVQEAKAKMIEAEAELVKFRAQSADEAGGARIAHLNERLDNTAIEIAELERRGDVVAEQYQESQAHAGQVAMKRIDMELLESAYRAAGEELRKLQTELERYTAPQVVVIPL